MSPEIRKNFLSEIASSGSLPFITSNPHKLEEVQKILKKHFPNVSLTLEHQNLTLTEIQSLDVSVVAYHKAIEAYKQLGKPALVEDTSLAYVELNGYPGALITWTLKSIGPEGLCHLANLTKERKAIGKTIFAISLDGKTAEIFEGTTSATIAREPRGTNGFGWNPIFIPDGQPHGQELTFGEMTYEQKDAYSMRTKAMRKFVEFVEHSML